MAVPVHIEVAAGDGKVFSSYDPELVEIIRAVVGREWHAGGVASCTCAHRSTRKHWVVPESEVAGLVIELTKAGFVAAVTQRQASADQSAAWAAERRKYEDEIAHLRRQLSIGGRTSQADSWADVLLGKCSTDQADKVYRALTRVLHPDVGGSTALMQEFNVARDRMQGKGGRR